MVTDNKQSLDEGFVTSGISNQGRGKCYQPSRRHARKAMRCRERDGVIFTHARVLFALLSLRKNGGVLVLYLFTTVRARLNFLV